MTLRYMYSPPKSLILSIVFYMPSPHFDLCSERGSFQYATEGQRGKRRQRLAHWAFSELWRRREDAQWAQRYLLVPPSPFPSPSAVYYYPGQKKEPSSRFAARRTRFHVWYHARSGAASAGQVRSTTVRDFCLALIAPDREWYHTWNSVLLAANLEDGSFFLSRVVPIYSVERFFSLMNTRGGGGGGEERARVSEQNGER